MFQHYDILGFEKSFIEESAMCTKTVLTTNCCLRVCVHSFQAGRNCKSKQADINRSAILQVSNIISEREFLDVI